jgi:hypothetical protein
MPYVLANLLRAWAVGPQVFVEMNDAGQDLSYSVSTVVR